MPHSTLTRDWTSRDLSLAMADLLARDDVGPCGHPHSVSTRPGAKDRYKVETDLVCGACAVLEEHRNAHSGHDAPGVLVRVVDVTGGAEPDEDTAFGPVFD